MLYKSAAGDDITGMENLRIGNGFDAHAFLEGRELVLGGKKIPHEKGLLGHSDADVLLHAIMDALLSAAALGDIGVLFPDSDARYKNISSIVLLGEVYSLLQKNNMRIINIDSTVICESPKIAAHVYDMKQNISMALGGLAPERIGIKGTTTEGLGFTGRGEGIAAMAAALLRVDPQAYTRVGT